MHRYCGDILDVFLGIHVRTRLSRENSAAFGFFGDNLDILTDVVEISFGIDMISRKRFLTLRLLEFFTEYLSEEDYYPVRDLRKIGVRYMK